MHLLKQIGHVAGLLLLGLVGYVLAFTGLCYLIFNRTPDTFADLLVLLIAGAAMMIASIYKLRHLWRQRRRRTPKELAQSELVNMTRELLGRGITKSTLAISGHEEKISIQRDTTLVDTEYSITAVITEQLLPTETCYRTTEMRTTLRFSFGRYGDMVERIAEFAYFPEPGVIKKWETKTLVLDRKYRIEGAHEYERSFKRATEMEISELIEMLRRAARSSGIVLDG